MHLAMLPILGYLLLLHRLAVNLEGVLGVIGTIVSLGRSLMDILELVTEPVVLKVSALDAGAQALIVAT